jgi:hypothetical protein
MICSFFALVEAWKNWGQPKSLCQSYALCLNDGGQQNRPQELGIVVAARKNHPQSA